MGTKQKRGLSAPLLAVAIPFSLLNLSRVQAVLLALLLCQLLLQCECHAGQLVPLFSENFPPDVLSVGLSVRFQRVIFHRAAEAWYWQGPLGVPDPCVLHFRAKRTSCNAQQKAALTQLAVKHATRRQDGDFDGMARCALVEGDEQA